MTVDSVTEREFGSCVVDLVPREVDAGGELTATGSVTCAPGCDLRGHALLIRDQDGALAGSADFVRFGGETNNTDPLVLTAPAEPGEYGWSAVCPAHDHDGATHAELSAPVSFTVRPHAVQVTVWDVPSAVERGAAFTVRVGVKCSSGCRPDGWSLAVRGQDGRELAKAVPGPEAWPGTDALYVAEVALTAPDAEGLFEWEAGAAAAGAALPHGEGAAGFGVRVAPAPECRLRVEAVNGESRDPVAGAKVVAHPYRAVTDARGVAELGVPKGQCRLFVSGRGYSPFKMDIDVTSDMAIEAELALDQGITDEELWS